MPGRVDNGCVMQLPFRGITMPATLLIDQIRSASRLMVRELGFMNSTLAAMGYKKPRKKLALAGFLLFNPLSVQ